MIIKIPNTYLPTYLHSTYLHTYLPYLPPSWHTTHIPNNKPFLFFFFLHFFFFRFISDLSICIDRPDALRSLAAVISPSETFPFPPVYYL